MSFRTFERLWDASYDYLQKNVDFMNILTSLMLEHAKQLRTQLFSAETSKRKCTFETDFENAHRQLLRMQNSLQSVVLDWKGLFAGQCISLAQITALPPDTQVTFEFMKPTLDFQVGQTINLTVTHIPYPPDGTFYAMDDSRKEIIRNTFATLQQSQKVPLTKPPQAGTVFNVCIEKIWHRAVCNAPETADEPLAIYLLDTGETIVYDELIPMAKLSPELILVPAYAIKCKTSQTSAPLPLRMYDSVSCEVVAIENDTVIVERKSAPPSEEYAISRETLTAEELKELDELPLSTSNPMKAVLGYVPKDDDRLCKHYDPETKRCFKGSNCRFRHEAKDPDGWTLDKDTVSVSVPARMIAPQVNSHIKILPTCVIDVDEIYVHLIGDESNDKAYERLMAEMNDPEAIVNYKPFNLLPSLGELVIAKYDDVWYRASVCDVMEDEVVVFYFDYGNTATLRLDEVRRWEDRFKFLPYQAACCRIANIQRIKPHHMASVDQLYKSIVDKPMLAMIVDNKHPWEIILMDNEGHDIGQLLVMAKLALPRTPKKFDQNAAIPG